jgi:hypothetical protein
MGVRPPSTDIDDEPGTIEFGIAALDARVEDRNVSFPVEATELEATHGDITVAVDPSGTEITLAEALGECDRESFDSKQDLLNALHPVFEEKRERLSGGVLGWLRSLLPF